MLCDAKTIRSRSYSNLFVVILRKASLSQTLMSLSNLAVNNMFQPSSNASMRGLYKINGVVTGNTIHLSCVTHTFVASNDILLSSPSTAYRISKLMFTGCLIRTTSPTTVTSLLYPDFNVVTLSISIVGSTLDFPTLLTPSIAGLLRAFLCSACTLVL
ncbi:Hypothetical protein, putative [Bodo saltans]|uniref:Uncharacterized protein n=1 Tax=Bodo saltans TaxID=75058 RepID=A0A0S4KNA2_BODSA|nr:Hypothetical protein, putative [Bodo saltans]|eukprot:CUI15087.1 Hypothetical protein, putative [Bodo saltans]